MKKIISWLFFGALFVVVLVAVAGLISNNNSIVEVNYYFGIDQYPVKLHWLIIVPFLVGLILGVALMCLSVFKHRYRTSVEKRKLVKVEKEVENLRALPLKDEV